MQKKVVIAIVVFLIVIAGGYFLMQNKAKNGAIMASPQTAQNNAGVFSSIQDALSKSLSLECDYTTDQGQTTKTYIKNGAIRADITPKDATQTEQYAGSVLIKDKKMYAWGGTFGNKGFVVDIPDAITPTPGGATGGLGQKEVMMSELEKYKQYCKPMTIADDLFTPPSDVTFTDYSQMQNMMMPAHGSVTGAPAGSGMTEEQMKAYQQQYMNKMPQGTSNNSSPSNP